MYAQAQPDSLLHRGLPSSVDLNSHTQSLRQTNPSDPQFSPLKSANTTSYSTASPDSSKGSYPGITLVSPSMYSVCTPSVALHIAEKPRKRPGQFLPLSLGKKDAYLSEFVRGRGRSSPQTACGPMSLLSTGVLSRRSGAGALHVLFSPWFQVTSICCPSKGDAYDHFLPQRHNIFFPLSLPSSLPPPVHPPVQSRPCVKC